MPDSPAQTLIDSFWGLDEFPYWGVGGLDFFEVGTFVDDERVAFTDKRNPQKYDTSAESILEIDSLT